MAIIEAALPHHVPQESHSLRRAVRNAAIDISNTAYNLVRPILIWHDKTFAFSRSEKVTDRRKQKFHPFSLQDEIWTHLNDSSFGEVASWE